jgi:class 3 adenylate cyclase
MSRKVSTTFLFTDLVGSTRMMERLGAAGDDLLRRHFALLRSTLAAHGGREVKNLGDGLMVTFATPAAGAACAAAMQRAIARHNATSEAELALGLRVGVHSGDAVNEGGDFFGMPVVIAKRLCDRCDSGQVLVSGVVRDVAAARGLEFADMGTLSLKGLSDPVPAAALDWDVTPADGLEQASRSASAPPPVTGLAMPAPLTTLATRELIGRRSELSLLHRELGQAQRGGRRLLFGGEPGIAAQVR